MVRTENIYKVWINPKQGRHYHILGCSMIDSPDYKEVSFRTLSRRKTFNGGTFHPCVCVEKTAWMKQLEQFAYGKELPPGAIVHIDEAYVYIERQVAREGNVQKQSKPSTEQGKGR